MNIRKILQQMACLVVVMLFLVGCGTPAATPVPPTVTPTSVPLTPTPIPPTDTPSQVFTLATSAEEIVDTWRVGSSYIRFDRDGTFREARALDELDNQPYSINTYQFEGTKMVITEVSVSGVPSCGKNIGSYEIRLLESGNIQIIGIGDECSHRAGNIAREYEPVR